jgi:YidC/Oxa1 family membrane protein insertase
MERKGLVFVVILILIGFIFLWSHNEGKDAKSKQSQSAQAQSSETVTMANTQQGNNELRRRNRTVVNLTDSTSFEETFSVHVTNEGAALESVRLHDLQYRNKARRSGPLFVPEELVAPGDYELVNVFGVLYYPFKFRFSSPDGVSKDAQITRVVRHNAVAKPVAGQAKQLHFPEPLSGDDLFIRSGDIVRFGELSWKVDKVVKTSKDPGLEPTDVRQTIALVDPVPEDFSETVTIIRQGDIFDQYLVDQRYTCVDCVAVEGSNPVKWVPSTPGGKVTFVWPNPAHDESAIWIERTWKVIAPYLAQTSTRIINLGTDAFRMNSGVEVTSWVDPTSLDVGMFSAQMKPGSPACFVSGEFEEEAPGELAEEYKDEGISEQGSIHWFGVNNQYFLLAGVFPQDDGLQGTCTLSADSIQLVAWRLQNMLETTPLTEVRNQPILAHLYARLQVELGYEPTKEDLKRALIADGEREMEQGNGFLVTSSYSRSTVQAVPGRGVFSEQSAIGSDPTKVTLCLPGWLKNRSFPWLEGSGITCGDAMAELGVDSKHLDEGSLERAVGFHSDPKRGSQLKQMLIAYREANRSGSLSMTVFAGPKDLDLLEETKMSLSSSLDFWFVGFIARPMLLLLKFSHKFVGSWAFAIIFLTVFVKVLLLPLTHKSFTQMQRMQQLKPEMDALRKKHKDDKQKLQAETMNLYKRHRINPLGGCLPMVFQMPVYIALYRTIYASVDLYQQPLFTAAWMPDMTQPDPYYILPVLLGCFMVVQQMLSPMGAGGDEMQQKIMKWMMPIMFGAFMVFLPSGLVLYIFVNTFLTIIQQWFIRQKMTTAKGST